MALESKMNCILISSFGKYSSILSSATVARSMSKKGYMVLGLVLIDREKTLFTKVSGCTCLSIKLDNH